MQLNSWTTRSLGVTAALSVALFTAAGPTFAHGNPHGNPPGQDRQAEPDAVGVVTSTAQAAEHGTPPGHDKQQPPEASVDAAPAVDVTPETTASEPMPAATDAPPPAPKTHVNGSHSTGTSGPGNSSQGCDGSHNSDTGHGANHSGPYDNTCDGKPSGNGNGGGIATKKPCAGCVGNADDKNPKGQMPNGSDHNAGYECDTNHGIGRTNPAHTGCKPTPPPPPCVVGTHLVGHKCVPDEPKCSHHCPPPVCMTNCPPPKCTVNCTPAPPSCTTNCTPLICTVNCAPPAPTCPSNMANVAGICTPPKECPKGQMVATDDNCAAVKGDSAAPATAKGGGPEALSAVAAQETGPLTHANLPFTGLQLAAITLLGTLLIGGGWALRSRRREATRITSSASK